MMISVLLAFALIAVVSSQQNDEAAVPDVCIPDQLTSAVEEASLLKQLNAGQSPVTEAPQGGNSLTTFQRRCEDGPLSVIHTVPNEFHWPPIYRGSCDNLFCKDPPCFVRRKIWRTQCVLVFQHINGYWRKIGYRNRHFVDHQSCGCKQCTDIRERQWCIITNPCPNSNNPDSFCHWIPFFNPLPPVLQADTSSTNSPLAEDLIAKPVPIGRCACCTPVYCRPPRFFNMNTCRCECPRIQCPTGQIFNTTTCECDCPPGSQKNVDGECIGNCDDISEEDLQWCSQTKCLEQPSKPHCVIDAYTNKCRCPRCADQTERSWCLNTQCGANNNIQCKWEPAWNRCFCPH